MCRVAEKVDGGVKGSPAHRILGCTMTRAGREDRQGYGGSKARPRAGTVHLS